jgi:hypothetical protein
MNFLTKKNKEQKKKPSALPQRDLEIGEQAHRDWKYMLAGFAGLVVVLVLLNGLLFIEINSGGLFTVEPDSQVNSATSNRKALLDVNNFFNMRQQAYENFRNGTTTEIDPSL